MNQVDHLLDLLAQRKVIFFCGAGVSMLSPSNAPSWWEIYAAAAKALHSRLIDGFPHIGSLAHLDELLSIRLSTQKLANLIIHRFAGRDFLKILPAIDIAEPNENHWALATLAAAGHLRGVVTTNYDTLLERSAVAKGVELTVATPGSGSNIRSTAALLIIKLHGTTIDPPNIIESTFQKAREISPTLTATWAPLMPDADLLVIGYSGADLDFGGVKAFFDDHVRLGRRIWWLHRPGSQPSLPPSIAARTSFIEGSLPDFLRCLVAGPYSGDLNPPPLGHSAKSLLAEAMEEWAADIGRWGAATFFLGLCKESLNYPNTSELQQALLKLSLEQSDHVNTATKIWPDDASSANFLTDACWTFLHKADFDSADKAMLAALTISNTLSVANEGGSAADIRAANLVATLNNFAVQKILGNPQASERALGRALLTSYLGGDCDGFVHTLANMLGYVLELHDVRRCSHLAEAGAELADRAGAVDTSIYLRQLLAMYAFDRNEIRLARHWLVEASRLSVSAMRPDDTSMITILLGECLIRDGAVEEGLLQIAHAARPGVAHINRAVEETRRYLDTLGAKQNIPFSIRLSPDDVPAIAAGIIRDATAARENGNNRWFAERCAISQSGFIGPEDSVALARIGFHELNGEASLAAEIGSALACHLLGMAEHRDARWVARNVIFNPSASAAVLAEATAAFASASAALGRLGEARQAFINCEVYYQKAMLQLPFWVARSGLWFFIQSGDSVLSAAWAGLAVQSSAAGAGTATELGLLIDEVRTWGVCAKEVLAVLCGGYDGSEKSPDPGRATPAETFRLFNGAHGIAGASFKEALTIVSNAAQVANEGNPKEGLRLLDMLAGMPDLPERVVGAASAVQIQILEKQLSIDELDQLFLSRRREMVSSMAFSALSCLERAYSLIKMVKEGPRAVSKNLVERGWIAYFSEDIVASSCLLAWYTQAGLLVGDSTPKAAQMHEYSLLPEYFGFGEVEIARLSDAPASFEAESRQNEFADELDEVTKTLASTDDAIAAARNVALKATALKVERKLTWAKLAAFRETLAMWYFERKAFKGAAGQFRRLQSAFRSSKDELGELHAMAGEGRALGRCGDYSWAVQVFDTAIAKANASYIPVPAAVLADLLLGLASAHLREASRGAPSINQELLQTSVSVFQHMLTVAPLSSTVRAFGRLGLARAYGESLQQKKALETLDLAIKELAHLGNPYAKLLTEHRIQFVEGAWQTLELE